MDREALQKMLLASFQQEAEERLQLLADQLAGWKTEQTSAGQVETLFLEIHSLKGAARAVGLSDTEQLCHHWETLLAAARKKPTLLNEHNIELCRQTLLLVRSLSRGQQIPSQQRLQLQKALEAAAKGQQAELPPPLTLQPDAAVVPASDRIKVNNQHLNTLLILAETAQQLKQESFEYQYQLKQLVAAAETLCKQQYQTAFLGLNGSGFAAMAAQQQQEQSVALQNSLEVTTSAQQQFLHHIHRLQRDSARLYAELAQLSDGLYSGLQTVLLVAGGVLFRGLAEMSNDLAAQTGKQLDLVLQDNNLQIDKRIIDELKPVIQHLLRNAVAHGIEAPSQRLASGKTASGKLVLSLNQYTADKFELKISDDGQGIDIRQLKTKALHKSLLSAEQLAALSDKEALALVFQSGLSTSPLLTEIAGRGLGMAIVQDIVERLAGEITLDSVAGQGLTIRILLPVSLSSFRALLIRCGERTLALPLFAVESCVRLKNDAIQYTENRATLAVGQQVLALWWLKDILQLPGRSSADNQQQTFVIVKVRGDSFALAVDSLLGDWDIIVKPLGPQLKKVRCVSGATLLGDGQLVPVLDPVTLYQQAQQLQNGAPEPGVQAAGKKLILIADDSFTSRALLKSIIETAGYDVVTANDGQEAWNQLKQKKFDLLVSDVEMPKLDGFNLTLKLRHDPLLSRLPVILVTALHSADDRQRGLEVGADAYLIKSGFEQESLLESIKRLI